MLFDVPLVSSPATHQTHQINFCGEWEWKKKGRGRQKGEGERRAGKGNETGKGKGKGKEREKEKRRKREDERKGRKGNRVVHPTNGSGINFQLNGMMSKHKGYQFLVSS